MAQILAGSKGPVQRLQGVIAAPTGDADMPRFLSDVERHEDTWELELRMGALYEEVRKRGGNRLEQWSLLRNGSRRGLHQSRRARHSEIMEKLLQDSARSPYNPPVVVVMMGPAGAGKTTRGVPLAVARHGVAFASVNADDVKERLPEYEGWNAGALHEESSRVAKELRDAATDQRMNIIYDITGTDAVSVQLGIKHFADYGYRVFLLLMELEPWRAAQRAWERFQGNPFGSDAARPPGRFVPPTVVYNGMGHLPMQTFDKVKNDRNVTGYCRVDGTTPPEMAPRILERKVW